MRVLVLSQYFWPENFRINDLVIELMARGHDVTVLTGVPNYPAGQVFPEFKRNPEQFASFSGASIIRIPIVSRGQGRLRLFFNYLSFVVSGLTLGPWRLRGRAFDTIFVYQISPITAALPALLLRHLKRASLLLWVLDLWPQTLAAVGIIRSPRFLAWIGRLVSFIYRRCDRILIQSRAFDSDVAKYDGDPARIRYFPGWAEPVFQSGSDVVAPPPELAAYRNSFNVLFAGNIGDAQDFPAILAAAEAIRDRGDVRWLIVGDGRAAQYVRTEIQSRGLADSVVMLGRYPIERMPSFFSAADALLVTLKKDPVFSLTIPGKVQSYLGAGVPILGMLDGEGARIIEESGAGLVCPAGDSRQLAEIVCKLAKKSPQERAMMGARGRAYCDREFNRAVLVEKLEAWMAELAQRKHARTGSLG